MDFTYGFLHYIPLYILLMTSVVGILYRADFYSCIYTCTLYRNRAISPVYFIFGDFVDHSVCVCVFYFVLSNYYSNAKTQIQYVLENGGNEMHIIQNVVKNLPLSYIICRGHPPATIYARF